MYQHRDKTHKCIFFNKNNKQKEELKETMNNKNTYKHIKKTAKNQIEKR
jgi:hypothetical protein